MSVSRFFEALKGSANSTKRKAGDERPFTAAEEKGLYGDLERSFADILPYMDYDNETKTFILQDVYSRAVVYSINAISTEGRSIKELIAYRDNLMRLFRSIPELIRGNWVVQLYNYSDMELYKYLDLMRANVMEHARGTEFTEEFFNVMGKHIRGIAKEDGLFMDEAVTNNPWSGCLRSCKLIIYRRPDERYRKDADFCPAKEINNLCRSLEQLFKSNRIKADRDDDDAFFDWMMEWLNPKPVLTNGDREKFYSQQKRLRAKAKIDPPFGYNLTESLLFSEPISDPENGCWWFDNIPHRYIRVGKLKSPPEIGALAGEVVTETTTSCFTDQLPGGSIVCQTLVFTNQDKFAEHVHSIKARSNGDTAEAELTRDAVEEYYTYRHPDNPICHASVGVFIRGHDLRDLKEKSGKVVTALTDHDMIPIEPAVDERACNAYYLHLPMVFDPEFDTKFTYLKPYYLQHAANMSLAFGRYSGTPHPALVFWNRCGNPIGFDPFGKDKENNAHAFILGDTGSGKSAQLNYITCMVMAMRRPRLYIIEAGDSFSLTGDYLARFGLKVVKKTIGVDPDITIPTFSCAPLLFAEEQLELDVDTGFDNEEALDEQLETDEDTVRIEPENQNPLEILERKVLYVAYEADIDKIYELSPTLRSVLRQSILQSLDSDDGALNIQTLHSKLQALTASLDDLNREQAEDIANGLITYFTEPLPDYAWLPEQVTKVYETDNEPVVTRPFEDEIEANSVKRDPLGEMELTSLLMLTNGDEIEFKKYGAAERGLIRRGILRAAEQAVKIEKREMLPEDLAAAFRDLRNDDALASDHRELVQKMALIMDGYTQGINGQLFNRAGGEWEDADVTIINLGLFAQSDSYKAQLAVSYVGLTMHINALAEKHQESGREILKLTDESHIITTNPLLAPIEVKIVKMWRKLGAWAWYATQNMVDFPNTARKLLSLMEWWFVLQATPAELEEVVKFKPLSDAEITLCLSARKQSGAYTEGVVLNKKLQNFQFRSILPSMYLSLAGTDKSEKRERKRVMELYNYDNRVDAAIHIANEIDKKRGIVH